MSQVYAGHVPMLTQPDLSMAVPNAWHNGATGTVSWIQPSWSRVDAPHDGNGRRVLPQRAARV